MANKKNKQRHMLDAGPTLWELATQAAERKRRQTGKSVTAADMIRIPAERSLKRQQRH